MVVANSTDYFDSDVGRNFACRSMDYMVGIYQSFVWDSTRCMCMDTEIDYPDCCIVRHTSNSHKAPFVEDTCKMLCQNTAG